ncbi:HNH endonuclease [Pseudomonas putida]|uniref:HNH endonuclease n=1 Tax=Pseudomonas putida TaxID=303 RepID=A0AA37R916_PSEPU|nr:HNH endonuclease [Pseudomonas putida]GLO12112.1 HNH endonuclease [Pseudomonas putida]GLO35505.1 HNH endonuclease [Pseudomonas putida]HDS0962824.1 HNH endonuclease [Pseudomonas putida]HDS0990058.1 HNH endonuclease [Pseudomonas putida]
MTTPYYPSRKAFIESLGATCNNWTWSWSFVNHQERKIIFGAWDIHISGGRSLILSEDWEIENGRRNHGYSQSVEHLRLVGEERYELYTFKITHSDERQDEDGAGPAKIKDSERSITRKWLLKQDGDWFAYDELPMPALPEEVSQPELYIEGAVREVTVNAYERSAQARAACIDHHKAVCAACEFDFGLVYGEVAEGLIHVHHIVPLSTIGGEYKLDPIKDLIPLCPNCHAVVHRGSEVMSIAKLKEHLAEAKRRSAPVA